MKYDIVALGEILVDFLPMGKDDQSDAVYARKAGGAPVNLLATASKFGAKTAFIGKVGNDSFGGFLRNTLKNCGISDKGLVDDNEHNTTLAFVTLDDTGDRSFTFYRNFGADTFLSRDEVDTELISNTKLFHFGSLSLTSSVSRSATEYAIDTAKKSGAIISYDPNYRALLWENEDVARETLGMYTKFADIIKLSKEEASLICGLNTREAAVELLYKQGRKIVLITDGANGVVYYGANELGYVPSLDVKPVDTTGAGDIFFGTFLSEVIKANKPVEALTFNEITGFVEKAVNISGKSTLRKGAITSIPDIK